MRVKLEKTDGILRKFTPSCLGVGTQQGASGQMGAMPVRPRHGIMGEGRILVLNVFLKRTVFRMDIIHCPFEKCWKS